MCAGIQAGEGIHKVPSCAAKLTPNTADCPGVGPAVEQLGEFAFKTQLLDQNAHLCKKKGGGRRFWGNGCEFLRAQARTDKSVGADQGRNFPVGLRELGFRGKAKGAESRWWDCSVAPRRARPWGLQLLGQMDICGGDSVSTLLMALCEVFLGHKPEMSPHPGLWLVREQNGDTEGINCH